ncbi:MAG TPA: MotA/TolQ/ExbB proton channel family protein [Acidobacteriaceae bacterium]|nr:MotA/TolQ/ExbB proton channel family protein [Acidobacteriaceae bacterium]
MISLLPALLLFQDTSPVAPPPVNNGNDIVAMLQNSGPVAMAVLIALLIGSLFSWAIILGKWAAFRRARTQSRRFLRAFRKANRLQEIATVSEQFKPSPLVNVFDEVYETYRRQTGGFGPPRNITALERAGHTAASESLTAMEQRLTWLASIGSISPFVGLFGTVMGIVKAFVGLGTEGTATLRAVAPGVAEALITTAAGLLVAIPAVIAYNQFTARCRDFAARMDDFARELLNSMEEAALKPDQDALEMARGLHK